ncbi:thiamine ABC transport system, permease protein [Escherichia coli]|uniref:Thiamine ABC transport system, permease protein n=1 Tax=Escherichia coli TaxID=562 RepID=A0A376MRF5_ECOLX|nr:thiamine ABC transport system, permease protein [Escherichia coli]
MVARAGGITLPIAWSGVDLFALRPARYFAGHVFFNLPMASRLLLQALENIPGEQRQLAAQLGMLAALLSFRRMAVVTATNPPVAALIFMLCFASFATVLSLGGGPQATTIELAIYQALSYDYDPARAAMLALIQMVCCLGLVLLSQRLSKAIAPALRCCKAGATRTIVCIAAFATRCYCAGAVAVAATVTGGARRWGKSQLPEVLAQPVLWQALWTSLRIALAAGVLA